MPQAAGPRLPEEGALLRRATAGDRAALGRLLEMYHRRVHHVCLRMVGSAEDAAELTQEAMYRAVRYFDSFERESRFSTWLFRIAMNLSISHLRKRRLRRAASLELGSRDESTGEWDDMASLRNTLADRSEPSAVSNVQWMEATTRLNQAIETLEPVLRGVLLLRDMQGMDYEEVAQAMDIPVGTVKSRLFRARLSLRKALRSLRVNGKHNGNGHRKEKGSETDD